MVRTSLSPQMFSYSLFPISQPHQPHLPHNLTILTTSPSQRLPHLLALIYGRGVVGVNLQGFF